MLAIPIATVLFILSSEVYVQDELERPQPEIAPW
jgi:hypothetical protein